MRRRRTTPLIAAVEGPAFGGGFEMALACDLVVASTTARFALPETRRGLVASSGGLFRAMRALPLDVARELLLTGAELDADRAERPGLLNRVTPPGGAVEAALELAREICASSPRGVRETLAALATQVEDADARGWQATAAAQETVLPSVDREEGIEAFLERRPPQWRGGDRFRAAEGIAPAGSVGARDGAVEMPGRPWPGGRPGSGRTTPVWWSTSPPVAGPNSSGPTTSSAPTARGA